jgi:hypothetical protein
VFVFGLMNDRLLLPTFFCPKPWEDMAGNEATRFCSYCRKHVHNLTALSTQDRLALLSSPAGSICARYRVAIRRPAKGKEESYMRHMLKYGAGVALSGSVLLVLWEMHEQGNRPAYYRASGGSDDSWTTLCEWPEELYEERELVTLGIMEPVKAPMKPRPEIGSSQFDHVDLKLDPVAVNQLFEEAKLHNLESLTKTTPDKR